MFDSLDEESKKSQITLIIIWSAMVMALFVYLFVCYMILEMNTMTFMKTPEFLNEAFIAGLSYKFIAYLSTIFIFIIAQINSKKMYNKNVEQTKNENIVDINEEFKFFRTRYTTSMFISLAIYESIAIIGIIIFLTTGDIITFTTFVFITFLGFITVAPTKNRLNYKKEFIN